MKQIDKNSGIKNWFDFVLTFTYREINSRYKHAILGFLWIGLNPLLQMLVIGFVFQFFVPVDVDNYFAFLLSGLLPWNFFNMSVSKTTPMFFYERGLIQKAKFPNEAIILSVVLSNFLNFVISFFIFLLVLSFLGLFHFVNLFLLLIGFIWLFLTTVGFSLFFSSLNVKYRDISFIVSAIFPLWFYATPVIYTLNLIPTDFRLFFYLNPITPIIEFFRMLLLDIPIYSIDHFILSSVSSILIFLIGIYVYKKENLFFDDWL